MTEAEWLTATDPAPLLEFLQNGATDRKLRLFAVACCWGAGASGDEALCEEARAAEEVADGQRAPRNDLTHHYEAYTVFHSNGGLLDRACYAAQSPSAQVAALEVAELLGDRCVAGCLREIFGNPFWPIAFSPTWRTHTVVALAQQMYDSRDFSAMPILADALQDAGCDSADIFDHCRGPGPHARGCWVLDLVLNKN